jgi:hypothetical protein
MKNLALAVALGLAAMAGAQEAAKPVGEKTPEKRESRVLRLKHADPERVFNLLYVFPVTARPDRELKAIAVSGTPEAVATYEEAVKRLDVPAPAPKNIELTAYILEASPQADPAWTVPTELQGVAKQLKTLFAFQGLRLLDTLALRTREGTPASATGVLPYSPTRAVRYNLDFNAAKFMGEERVIRIDRLCLRASPGPGASPPGSFELRADLDFKEGQKAVVGKTGTEIENKQSTLILILSGKAAE